MKHTPHFLLTDPDEVKRLIRENPWATFVSNTSKGLVASHYPVMVDEDADELTIVSHFGRPDERNHEVGEHEMLVIIQGPHDYVSASWYDPGQLAATWNHVTAHLYGVPEVLSEAETYEALSALTDYLEHPYPEGRSLDEDEAWSGDLAKGAVGVRMRVTRFDARAKVSQNKPQHVYERVVTEFDKSNPRLAAEMRHFNE
ncbi:FMN-binding negative transcriptional regulator [Gulosibacter molinativorax]|uniref:FMN-binding negative transcriptional regulator n=1 Tax=Gulosibacter molinativorax TaxID=256821 RepID=A0ABT7CA66_9MICO|nr:FMN-binding negative transcriptional regulator [Gulosibacter molinativorax]MDJ1372099.1 FMN-binding negative transcriptional regulator [Gulosibacter molinativorax]QUY62357.1 Protease synthase and sporulation protein PAI 2 [Gulosibacter molinativorax]